MTKVLSIHSRILAFCLLIGLIPVGVLAITPSGTQIQATSTATYSASDGRLMPTSTSNTVVTTVGQSSAVTVTPSTDTKSAGPGKVADSALTVTNGGNGSDTFDLTVASAGSWVTAIYKDDNGDGIRQSTETTVVSNTGVLSAGGSVKCIVSVTTPNSGTGASDTVTFTAKSRLDATRVATSVLTIQQGSATPSAEPYIQSWLVNGSYPNHNSVTRLSRDYLVGEASVAPLEGSFNGGKMWFEASTQTEVLDLGLLFGGATYCAGYVFSYVYSPSALTVDMWMGSDDGIKVWINGGAVWSNNIGRSCVLEQDKIQVRLNQGWNKVLVKVSQGKGSWQVAVKLCDSTGKAVPGLVYNTKPAFPTDTAAPVISNIVITPSSTSCRITWTTDEPATSLLDYGGTDALGQSSVDYTMTTAHDVSVTDLMPGMIYYARVGSSDAAGNSAWDGPAAFTTTIDPPSGDAPYIQTWLLNGYFTSDQATRMSTDYLGGEASIAPLEGSVTAGRTWTRVSTGAEAFDLAAAWYTASGCAAYLFTYVYSATTQAVDLRMGSDDGITVWVNGAIVWSNDVYRSLTLDQDITQAELKQGWNRMLVKVTQDAGGWSASLRLCDSEGNTLPGVICDTKLPDSTAPVLSNVAVTPSDTSCLFEWDTDEPAGTLLDYGTTSSLGQDQIDPDLTTHHSATLTGLTPGTTYYVNLGSADAVGNVAWDGVRTILTTSPSIPPPAASAYIQDWLVNGYYRASSSVRMGTDFIGGEAAASPKAGDFAGGNTWTAVHTSANFIDLGVIFGGPSGCAGYSYTNVYSPVAQPANLWMGSDDGLKVWVNGTAVWTVDTWRSMVPDQDKVPIALRQGWNRLLIKVTQGGGGWQAIVKVCDSSGNQLPGVAFVP